MMACRTRQLIPEDDPPGFLVEVGVMTAMDVPG
jgi:hypothetical protein